MTDYRRTEYPVPFAILTVKILTVKIPMSDDPAAMQDHSTVIPDYRISALSFFSTWKLLVLNSSASNSGSMVSMSNLLFITVSSQSLT